MQNHAGKDARADNIGGARHALTIVTSLWENGEAGLLTIVFPVGFLKDEERQQLQLRFAPDVYFLSSGRASHFMNAEIVVEFMEGVLRDVFEKRRTRLGERYGRSFQDEWGLLLADSFTGHHATNQGSDLQRDFAANVCFKKVCMHACMYVCMYVCID